MMKVRTHCNQVKFLNIVSSDRQFGNDWFSRAPRPNRLVMPSCRCWHDIYPQLMQTLKKHHSIDAPSKFLMRMVQGSWSVHQALCLMSCTFGTFAMQDFREMVFCIYNICTLDANGLLMLIFDLYDADGSDSISKACLKCRPWVSLHVALRSCGWAHKAHPGCTPR